MYKVKDRFLSFSNSASQHPGVRVNGVVAPLVFNAGTKFLGRFTTGKEPECQLVGGRVDPIADTEVT